MATKIGISLVSCTLWPLRFCAYHTAAWRFPVQEGPDRALVGVGVCARVGENIVVVVRE